ncbi:MULTISPECIES: response regulator transcription factor [Dehalobacter]|uniref:Stage 0 sporulation protein A homolog n=2 Tax=Dehalobacter restrictus TaxID=55583 RepID=A0A857DH54_9FIRM|nr:MULTISPECIES: response regulator transcription factor [Dehalobacter]AHF09286.1 XRE family transcriptional regulator [Dehalobacter restrictus DSM 9455]MCG1025264.1 response regulator transcription factor [Dehalobacter sp.]MDJ0305855.1 response regulator transcription factor [Dehalobacter sp.]OCZ52304.1 DNA-binding response regulator [Dehalobacter sp. TeCB1]QGZ99821.1 response regulator [Dehalobacter restrictus]
MEKILIIEDNKKIRDELCIFLSQNGYECHAPGTFEDMIGFTLSLAPQLILIDLNLPVYDGFHICREIRKHSEVPVIVVTSRDTEMDELAAMNLGADDFITKPYNTHILLARIAAVMKRVYRETAQDRLTCGEFTINLAKSSLEVAGSSIELTKNEIKMLTCLCEKKGAIVSRDELMRYLWNSDLFIDDNTLTVNMGRLRRKLEDAGLENVIETKRGQGYLII